MKKLVLVFVAVVAMSFASCGNKAAQEAPVADSDSIAAVVDSHRFFSFITLLPSAIEETKR